MSIELGFALACGLAAAALAWYTARGSRASDQRAAGASRPGLDLVRAGASIVLRSHGRVLGAATLLAAFVMLVGVGFARSRAPGDPASAPLDLAGWSAVAMLTGALSVAVAQRAGAAFGLAAIPPLGTAPGAVCEVVPALRLALAAGLADVAAVVVTLAALCAAHAAWLGGAGASADSVRAGWLRLPALLFPYALGACLASFGARLLGGAFGAAASLTARFGGESPAPLAPTHRDNPASVALLVADGIDHALVRSPSTCALVGAGLLASMALGARAVEDAPSRFPEPGAVVVLPIVLVGFGLVATMVSVAVLRVESRERPEAVLDRTLGVALLLSMAASVAASRWLLDAHWLAGAVPAAIGVASVWAQRHAARRVVESHRLDPGAGPAGPLLGGLGVGLGATCTTVAIALVPLSAGWFAASMLGPRAGLDSAGALGVSTALAGMLAPIACTSCLGAFASAARAAEGSRDPEAPAPQPSPAACDRVSAAAEQALETQGIGSRATSAAVVGVCLTAVPAALGVRLAHAGLSAAGWAAAAGLAAAMAVGAVGVVALATSLLRGVARTAGEVLQEVHRHLESGQASAGELVLPQGYEPEHLACLELLLRATARGVISSALVCGAAAVALPFAGRAVLGRLGTGLGAAALVAVLGGAWVAVTVCGAAAPAAAGAWRRGAGGARLGGMPNDAVDERRKKTKNPHHGAAVASVIVGDPFERLAGPTLHALIELLVTATVVLAPLFL